MQSEAAVCFNCTHRTLLLNLDQLSVCSATYSLVVKSQLVSCLALHANILQEAVSSSHSAERFVKHPDCTHKREKQFYAGYCPRRPRQRANRDAQALMPPLRLIN